MNWKKYVEQKNEETYVLPQGWDSRETVANELECSPEKVDDHLRPGLKSGEIQKQQFRIWDQRAKRLIFVVAYSRTAPAEAERTKDWTEEEFAQAKKLRASGKGYAEIGKAIGRTRSSVKHKLSRAS